MENGIAIAGSLVVDYIKYIDYYPAPQALATVSRSSRSTGGLACNCALTLSRLGAALPLKVIGLVGQDEAGEFVLSQLGARPNIDASRILRQGVTSYTDVMTEEQSGRRTFFHYRGANALLTPEHFDFSDLKADILHIGYILALDSLDAPDPQYPTALCRVLDAAQKAGIRTSVDMVSEESERFKQLARPALRYADYCVINETEASRTTGIALRDTCERLITGNLPKACRSLMDMGVKRWAVVHAPEISCGLERGGGYYEEYSWKIPNGFIKSTVGAGDAFSSGVLYGAYHGWNLEKSLHTAGAVAAYSLSGTGASDAVIPLPALLAKMERL